MNQMTQNPNGHPNHELATKEYVEESQERYHEWILRKLREEDPYLTPVRNKKADPTSSADLNNRSKDME